MNKLRTQPSGGNCVWQVLEVIFQAKSYELTHQNTDPAPLSCVYLHHQLQEKKILEEKKFSLPFLTVKMDVKN